MARFSAVRLDPPRPALREAITGRFTRMLAEGAIDEVRALLALGLDPALPAMRAHGVDVSNMTVRGYGESRPVADNATDEGRAINRRVEAEVEARP